MITEQQIQKAKAVLLKYTAPDALKPEYDGMSAHELTKLILKASQTENKEDIIQQAVEEKINACRCDGGNQFLACCWDEEE